MKSLDLLDLMGNPIKSSKTCNRNNFTFWLGQRTWTFSSNTTSFPQVQTVVIDLISCLMVQTHSLNDF